MLAVDTAAIERAAELAHRWSVSVDESFETPTSVVSYGRRDGRAVVLKVVKRPGDEWRSGQIASAFGGNGFVRVLEYVEGAMLLDRLEPGTPRRRDRHRRRRHCRDVARPRSGMVPHRERLGR
jgi:streptomycin 6-kinase